MGSRRASPGGLRGPSRGRVGARTRNGRTGSSGTSRRPVGRSASDPRRGRGSEGAGPRPCRACPYPFSSLSLHPTPHRPKPFGGHYHPTRWTKSRSGRLGGSSGGRTDAPWLPGGLVPRLRKKAGSRVVPRGRWSVHETAPEGAVSWLARGFPALPDRKSAWLSGIPARESSSEQENRANSGGCVRWKNC